jgi:hypothetical protein
MKRIKSTRDLKVNDVLRVYKKGFGYSKLTVIDVHPEFISARAERDFVENVRQGDILESYFWSNRMSSYDFQLQVLGLFSIDLQIVFFKHTGKISWSRERKCLEAKVNIPFSFFIFDVDDIDSVFSSTDVKIKKGKIVRLGDREALFQYRGSLKNGAFIKGHLNVHDEKMDVIGKIDYAEGFDNFTHLLNYTGMADRDREKILDYVFTIYRE